MAGSNSLAVTTAPVISASRSNLPDPQTTRILVGEVNLINSTVIKKMLERLGYQTIVQVENGVQAVDVAEKEHFHFIFLDLRMPMIGGVEATKLIRKHEKEKQKTEHATIIGLSAVYTDKALLLDKQICYECGMNSVLRMPLHIMDLRSILASYKSHKTPESLRTLTMMYITNQPHLFQYTTKHPSSIFCVGEGREQTEVCMPTEIMEDLQEMKESYPSYYKYPKFDDLDHSEILCLIPSDYEILKKGVGDAIEAKDIQAVHRCATALVAILKYVSSSAESTAVALSSCKDTELATKLLTTLKLYMYHVWE